MRKLKLQMQITVDGFVAGTYEAYDGNLVNRPVVRSEVRGRVDVRAEVLIGRERADQDLAGVLHRVREDRFATPGRIGIRHRMPEIHNLGRR